MRLDECFLHLHIKHVGTIGFFGGGGVPTAAAVSRSDHKGNFTLDLN